MSGEQSHLSKLANRELGGFTLTYEPHQYERLRKHLDEHLTVTITFKDGEPLVFRVIDVYRDAQGDPDSILMERDGQRYRLDLDLKDTPISPTVPDSQ